MKAAKTLRMPFIRDQKMLDLAETYVRTRKAARENRKAKEALRKYFLPLLEQGHSVARLGAFRVLMKKTPTTVYRIPEVVKGAYRTEDFRRSVDIEEIPIEG